MTLSVIRALLLPMLTLFSILVGWFGGAMMAATNEKIAISYQTFFSNLRQTVEESVRGGSRACDNPRNPLSALAFWPRDCRLMMPGYGHPADRWRTPRGKPRARSRSQRDRRGVTVRVAVILVPVDILTRGAQPPSA